MKDEKNAKQPKQPPKKKEIESRIEHLELQLSAIEKKLIQLLPKELRTLTEDQVVAAMGETNLLQFEVLADWKYPGTGAVWRAGRRVRGCDYPNLRDLIRAGLRLGIPENNAEIVEDLRLQANALEVSRAAQAAAAQAAAQAAQASTLGKQVEVTSAEVKRLRKAAAEIEGKVA